MGIRLRFALQNSGVHCTIFVMSESAWFLLTDKHVPQEPHPSVNGNLARTNETSMRVISHS